MQLQAVLLLAAAASAVTASLSPASAVTAKSNKNGVGSNNGFNDGSITGNNQVGDDTVTPASTNTSDSNSGSFNTSSVGLVCTPQGDGLHIAGTMEKNSLINYTMNGFDVTLECNDVGTVSGKIGGVVVDRIGGTREGSIDMVVVDKNGKVSGTINGVQVSNINGKIVDSNTVNNQPGGTTTGAAYAPFVFGGVELASLLGFTLVSLHL